MTYTEFIIEIENNIAKANCNKLNIGEYEEKQKQIYKQIRADAIDEFVRKVKEHHYVLSDVINSTDYGMFTVGIEQIAEELKAGEHNAKTKSES